MISVIVTTYNRRSFLKEAVASVLNQDYVKKEIIVIDDGSTDRSDEEIRGLPVDYIWKTNGGISSARNKGIEAARGTYIAFLDVDDIWKPRKLSTQLAMMEEGGYQVSYTDEIWLRDGKHLNQKLRHRKFTGHIFEKCLPLCIISPSSVVMKRDIFDEIGLFDESMPVCEDYDMWLRLTVRYPVLFIEKPLIIKQGGHEDQLSRKYAAMDRFRIESIARLLQNNELTESMRRAATEELARKCSVYMKGALRRGKEEEVRYCRNLLETFQAVETA